MQSKLGFPTMPQNSSNLTFLPTYLHFQFLEASRELVRKRLSLGKAEFYLTELDNEFCFVFTSTVMFPHNSPHLAKGLCSALSGNYVPFIMNSDYFSSISYMRRNKPMRYIESQPYTSVNPRSECWEYGMDWKIQNQLFCEFKTQLLLGGGLR